MAVVNSERWAAGMPGSARHHLTSVKSTYNTLPVKTYTYEQHALFKLRESHAAMDQIQENHGCVQTARQGSKQRVYSATTTHKLRTVRAANWSLEAMS